jgi:hypothetical protein
MPEYELLVARRLGKRDVARGEGVTFLAWPSNAMAAANDAAERVVEYLRCNYAHPDFPICPWNEYDHALWLPQLAASEKPDTRPQFVGAPRPLSSADARRGHTPRFGVG